MQMRGILRSATMPTSSPSTIHQIAVLQRAVSLARNQQPGYQASSDANQRPGIFGD